MGERRPSQEGQHVTDLPSEHVVEEDVVRRLKFLSTKRISQVAIDATLLD